MQIQHNTLKSLCTKHQFDSTHSNSSMVKFKLAGVNNPSGHLCRFESPPAQRCWVVNSTWHQSVNAPQQPCLNNLCAACSSRSSPSEMHSVLQSQLAHIHASRVTLMKETRLKSWSCMIDFLNHAFNECHPVSVIQTGTGYLTMACTLFRFQSQQKLNRFIYCHMLF